MIMRFQNRFLDKYVVGNIINLKLFEQNLRVASLTLTALTIDLFEDKNPRETQLQFRRSYYQHYLLEIATTNDFIVLSLF